MGCRRVLGSSLWRRAAASHSVTSVVGSLLDGIPAASRRCMSQLAYQEVQSGEEYAMVRRNPPWVISPHHRLISSRSHRLRACQVYCLCRRACLSVHFALDEATRRLVLLLQAGVPRTALLVHGLLGSKRNWYVFLPITRQSSLRPHPGKPHAVSVEVVSIQGGGGRCANPCRRTFAKGLAAELAEETQHPWRFYLLDLRNHGASHRKPGFEGPHTLETAAHDLVRFASEVVRCVACLCACVQCCATTGAV
jgi:pimeloyl-ACP methyl ester carboxylesterase